MYFLIFTAGNRDRKELKRSWDPKNERAGGRAEEEEILSEKPKTKVILANGILCVLLSNCIFRKRHTAEDEGLEEPKFNLKLNPRLSKYEKAHCLSIVMGGDSC